MTLAAHVAFSQETSVSNFTDRMRDTVKAVPFVTCQNSCHFNIDRRVLKRTERESQRTMGNLDEYSIPPFCFPLAAELKNYGDILSLKEIISCFILRIYIIIIMKLLLDF